MSSTNINEESIIICGNCKDFCDFNGTNMCDSCQDYYHDKKNKILKDKSNSEKKKCIK
jgi:hypothetical protein